MNETRDLLERVGERFTFPDDMFERLEHRRDQRRRNKRIAAGAVGIAVFVAAVWIVTSVGSFDRTQTPAVPGGAETGPTETGPGEASGPVPETDYLFDLDTGETTPLPKSIVGREDVTGAYAVSPDGSRLAYLERGDSGEFQISVANLDGTRLEQVTAELRGEAMPSSEAAPAWSPDGSRIAYIGRRTNGDHGNVYLLDLATGVSTQVTDDPRDGANSPTFSPDGSFIVYSAHREGGDQILAVLVAGGASVPLLGGDGAYAQTPALSPDGSLLSYVCGDVEEVSTGICLANADGSGARVFVPVAYAGDPAWSPDGTRIAFWAWRSGLHVVDVATGEDTLVNGGPYPTWLDGHTLIVETDECNRPHDNCGF